MHTTESIPQAGDTESSPAKPLIQQKPSPPDDADTIRPQEASPPAREITLRAARTRRLLEAFYYSAISR